MSVAAIALKHLRETVRQPRTLALGLGLPVAFMVIFGLAFGQEEGNRTLDVALLDEDGGALALAFAEGLDNLTYDDGSDLVRLVRVATLAEGMEGLEARDTAALVVVPAGFTEGLTPTPRQTPGGPAGLGGTQTTMDPPPGASVVVRGDPSFSLHGVARQVVEGYAAAFEERVTGRAPALEVQSEAVTSARLTDFDHIAPGLMVFAVLNLAPQAASMLARESELQTLDRIRQSPTRAARLLGGVALAQLVLAAVSLALMLLAARLMGFHAQGSYLLAYGIALAAAVAVVGLGMVIASFARTQQEAANLGILVAVPGSFLSGSFFPIPGVDLFTLGGRTVGLYDLLPTTHAVEALRAVLTFGRGADAIGAGFAALAALSVLFFLAGVGLYRRARLAPV